MMGNVLEQGTRVAGCALCDGVGGEVIWQTPIWRIVLVNEEGYPGFCRVILNRHVAEMTDLASDERDKLMNIVYAVEAVMRRELKPRKINLASLGNMVSHLHWHVIPRWDDDPHFPQAVWSAPVRPVVSRQIDINRLKAGLASAMLLLDQAR